MAVTITAYVSPATKLLMVTVVGSTAAEVSGIDVSPLESAGVKVMLNLVADPVFTFRVSRTVVSVGLPADATVTSGAEKIHLFKTLFFEH